MESFKEIDILKGDYLDIGDLNDNLDFYRNLFNLREFETIFNHEKLIEKELYLFLLDDLPEFIPYFYYVQWQSLEQYKEEINDCKKINLNNLNLSPKTIKDINSLFGSELSEIKSGDKNSKNQNKSSFSNDSVNSGKKNSKKQNKSNDSNNTSKSKEDQRLEESTLLDDDDDFKLKDTIETIKYEPCKIDNEANGKLFESDILNYIYEIFYILSSGKLNMMRNKKYMYDKIEYELDFQIVNLNLKNFLYFIALLYPNISKLDTLNINIANIFNNFDSKIFEIIDNLILNENLKEFEYIDILGEITIDYLNIAGKKNLQFEKYKSLIQKLENNPTINKEFNFIEKNKKIIITITNGKYEIFYEKFKKINHINLIDIDNNRVNYLFIYVNKKVDECKILKEKLIFNYINLLEKKLEKSEINDDEDNIIKYKCLKLGEINENFYNKVNASRKLESFRSCLRKINKDYINRLPSFFSKYINKNINFEEYKPKLKEILNIKFKSDQQIYEKLNNKYKDEKNKTITNISLYEISGSEFHFENYKNNKIKIFKYKKANANKTDLIDIKKFGEELNEWFDNNYKSGSLINVIVLNIKEFDNYIIKLINEFFNLENKKDYIVCHKKDLSKILEKNLNFVERLAFEDINEILNSKIIELKAKKQYMQSKLYFFINYVDKLIKDKIITDKVENNKNNNYFDELLIKINQESAIFYNFDICKYNDKVIDLEKLKNFINDIYSTIDVSKFKEDSIAKIVNNIKKNLSFKKNDEQFESKIKDIFTMKFNSNQALFVNIYLKYFQKKYNSIKKNIKSEIINNFIDNIKN